MPFSFVEGVARIGSASFFSSPERRGDAPPPKRAIGWGWGGAPVRRTHRAGLRKISMCRPRYPKWGWSRRSLQGRRGPFGVRLHATRDISRGREAKVDRRQHIVKAPVGNGRVSTAYSSLIYSPRNCLEEASHRMQLWLLGFVGNAAAGSPLPPRASHGRIGALVPRPNLEFAGQPYPVRDSAEQPQSRRRPPAGFSDAGCKISGQGWRA